MKRITEKEIDYVRIVYNRWLPFPGYRAMMLFGKIYAGKSSRTLDRATIRHELIHAAQAADCGSWMGYYLKYLRCFLQFGYQGNPFEREAYRWMYVAGYLDRRREREWESYVDGN